MAVIRLEPGSGRAAGHPGRVAQVCVRPVGVLQGSWVVTGQPDPKGWWFPLCLQLPSPSLRVSSKLSMKLSFSPHHLIWARNDLPPVDQNLQSPLSASLPLCRPQFTLPLALPTRSLCLSGSYLCHSVSIPISLCLSLRLHLSLCVYACLSSCLNLSPYWSLSLPISPSCRLYESV